jgi:hypothetical protein
VGINAEVHSVGDAMDRLFERIVVERLHGATGCADQVVMVGAVGMVGLKARDAIAGK